MSIDRIDTKELSEVIAVLAENRNLRVTFSSSLKAAAVVGGSTFVGAVILGPVGIVIGASAGALYSYTRYRGKFKSVAIIIKDEFTEDQKKRLCKHIVNAFRNFQAEDNEKLAESIQSNQAFQSIVLEIIREFFQFDVGIKIVD